ncbi:hypothetical protein QQF64_004507 [Cirrhinus molitorella]|uniref:ADP-ribosylarginine hydrolase n=1 Tax=Cirrhinus molitorella TaxID=172907 RepID=A0ABR3MGE0_9TELE
MSDSCATHPSRVLQRELLKDKWRSGDRGRRERPRPGLLFAAYVQQSSWEILFGGSISSLLPWDPLPGKEWLARYLDLRGLSLGTGPVAWPDQYGPAERDKAYTSFSLSGWGGGCGHDAPMIALDALLGAGSDWEELMSRAGFHGGDSDSTAVIACCCWGVLYGIDGVPQCNYRNLEYRGRLENVAQKLYALSH